MNRKQRKKRQQLKPIEHHPLTSSMLTSAGFCPDRKCIEVKFTNGSLYQYHDCDQSLYDQLKAAKSAGAFVNQHLKPKKFTKL
jgi:hypothetical protein